MKHMPKDPVTSGPNHFRTQLEVLGWSSGGVASTPLKLEVKTGSDADPRRAESCIISRPPCTSRPHVPPAARPWSSAVKSAQRGAHHHFSHCWGPNRSFTAYLSPGITRHGESFPAGPLGYSPETVAWKRRCCRLCCGVDSSRCGPPGLTPRSALGCCIH